MLHNLLQYIFKFLSKLISNNNAINQPFNISMMEHHA